MNPTNTAPNYVVKAGDKFNPFTGQALGANQGVGTMINSPYLNQGGNNPGYSAPSSAPTVNGANIPKTLNSNSLTGSTPLNLPVTTYPSSPAGLQGLIQSTYQNSIDSLQPGIDKNQATNDFLSSQLGDIYGKIAQKPQITEAAYNEQGVDQKKQALTDINNQIMGEVNALNHQKDAIFNAPGVTREQAQQQFQEVQRMSLSKQADLAVVQSAASQNYANAQSIADRKIQMQFEGYQNQLDALKFFYTENKDTLTKKEDQQFQLKIKQQDTALNLAISQAKTLQDTKIDTLKEAQSNGAPVSVMTAIQQAENPEAAVAAAGNYLGLYDRLSKISQIAKNNAEKLPASSQARIQQVAGQFDGEQAVKNYQTIAETVDAVMNASNSPTDDIQRIYAAAKVFDPNSAVREGEYKTVQDYATTLLQRAGLKTKRVFDNVGFLTPEARTFINTTLQNRLASSKKAYDNIYNSYGQRINKITGSNDGTDYITNYGAAFEVKKTDSDPLGLGINGQKSTSTNPLGL